jgi:hypothetical protein
VAIELTPDLIRLQTASDKAWAAVLEGGGEAAYAVWRERAAEVRAAVTAHAAEIGEPRNKVEQTLKTAVRHPAGETEG